MKLFTKTRDKNLNTNRCSGGGNFSCRHPKLWSYIKSNIKAFFITGAITFVVSASATTILHSRQVRYKNDKSVEQAINELYQKADECKRQEMSKMGCDGCTKLEYLESTGTQYIDTQFSPNQDSRVICEFKINDLNMFNAIFGVRVGVNNRLYSFYKTKAGTLGTGYSNEQIDNIATPDTNKHLVDKNKNYTYIDGKLKRTQGYGTFTTPGNMYIYVINNNNAAVSSTALVSIFSFQIYDNDTLVRDYIPVLDANDRPCLFDKVSKTCFYNQGTGEFLYG